MRVIDQIPNDVFTITVFTSNNRYLIKFEAGPMEQTYKLSADNFASKEEIRAFVDQLFLEETRTIHNQMFLNMKAALERFKNE